MKNKLAKTVLALGLTTLVANSTILEKSAYAVEPSKDRIIYASWSPTKADSYVIQMQENFGRYKLINSSRASDVCGVTICADAFSITANPSSALLFRIAGNYDSGLSSPFSAAKSPANSPVGERAFVATSKLPQFTNKKVIFMKDSYSTPQITM